MKTVRGEVMTGVGSQRPPGGQISPSWRSEDPQPPQQSVSTVLICNHSDKDKCSPGGGVTTSPPWSTRWGGGLCRTAEARQVRAESPKEGKLQVDGGPECAANGPLCV